MIEFEIQKKSKKSGARLGLMKTPHGVVETPCLVPVATQAVIKTLTSEEVKETKSQILICNTYHLNLQPGPEIIKKAGGLHEFMNWNKSLMTDSGGFQVFSLGFGKDFGTGKMLKSKTKSRFYEIQKGQQPKLLKITEDGVYFRSFISGQKIFLGPKESIKIQEKLGADIIFAFDECTSPVSGYEYTKKSLQKTHKWAKICLSEKASEQAIYGIVQGGRFKDLRIESAKFIGGLSFDGFGIGGEFGDDKTKMSQMLKWVLNELPEEKPRHLLGIGHFEDIPKIIKLGIDTFDCIAPTHYARRGIIFNLKGKLDLSKKEFLKDKNPLDKNCDCFVCQNYRRNYISHLLRSNELTALKLLTFHNLYFFNTYIEEIRKKIKKGKI
ncbi:MAG: tRNA guanosine(34) transglycosylase Tgt [Candidatus Pacebacteria bacterium]|nr:tRNA guanosine(34) transglycosylase Tgt [Candidatus Paceibacterota bacterium]